ncbi:periphilin-1-like [Pongo pygmaeus]|uniref:periphilin-1-like n=1 Tax=Pongo pygmaeus TaxID=9600 RepID=UPI0023E28B7D|nr:periphilin-1-like [Pongo pygmaeus]
MNKLCECSQGVCDHGTGDWRDSWIPTTGLVPPVQAMSQLNLNVKMERGLTGVTLTSTPMTCRQIKKTTQEAEKLLEHQGQAKTPDSMFVAMLAMVSCASVRSAGPPTGN